MKVGVLRYDDEPMTVARCLMALANVHDIEMFYFTPERINMNEKSINGIFLQKGKYIEKETTFPEIIDDWGAFRYDYRDMYREMVKECLFVFNPLGGKAKQLMIFKQKKLTEYMIDSFNYKDIDVDELLVKYKVLILKPNNGAGGSEIYKLHREDEIYVLQTNTDSERLTKEEFLEKYDLSFKKRYIVQEFINSTTKKGVPFHMRLNTRRARDGRWKILAILPFIGVPGAFASNLAVGGSINVHLEEFLESEFGDEWQNVLHKLETIATDLPDILQTASSNLISMFGFDVGIIRDKNNEFKIYEVNSSPDERVSNHFENAEHKIQYYMYLMENFDEIFKKQKPQFI